MSTRRVAQIKKQFRLLEKWDIRYTRATKTMNALTFYPRKRAAIIYGYGEANVPKDYYLHEVLHCALRELSGMDRRKIKKLRRAEEELVGDICGAKVRWDK